MRCVGAVHSDAPSACPSKRAEGDLIVEDLTAVGQETPMSLLINLTASSVYDHRVECAQKAVVFQRLACILQPGCHQTRQLRFDIHQIGISASE